MTNQREAFKKFWAEAHGKDSLNLIDNEISGVVYWEYVFSETRCAWEAWKAAQADQADTIAQLQADRSELEYACMNRLHENEKLKELLARYRNETPLGYQPSMIVHEVDEALGETE